MALAPCLVALLAAANPRLDEARRHLDKLEYLEAAQTLEQAAAVEGNERDVLLDIYELQGVIAGFLKKPDEALRAFQRVLVLDPQRKLHGRYPPRVTTPFFEAKTWAKEHGVLAASRTAMQAAQGKITTLGVRVETDPLGLAKAVQFAWIADGVAGAKLQPLAAGLAEVAVSGARVEWSAVVVGEHQAQLLALGSAAQPMVDAAPVVAPKTSPGQPPPPPEWATQGATVDPSYAPAKGTPPPPGWAVPEPEVRRPAPSPTRRHWFGAKTVVGIVLLVLGAACEGAGAAFGVLANDGYAQLDQQLSSMTHDSRATLQRLNNDTKGDAIIADTGFVVGGVAAGLGVILLLAGLIGAEVEP